MFVLRTGFARAAATFAVKNAFCRQVARQPPSTYIIRASSMATTAPTDENEFDHVNHAIDESEYTVLDDQSMRRFTGKGIRRYCDGFAYTGDWLNGSQHGLGRIQYPDCVYIGEVVDGTKHGLGQQTYPDGATLIGRFHYDIIVNGRGTLKLPSGVIWEGEFVNGFFEGKGKRTNADGTTIEGEWREGLIYRGFGTLPVDDGRIIKLSGEFRKSQLYNGKGHFVSRYGGILIREWVAGVEQEIVGFIFPSGDTYKGQMKHFRMHGQGILRYRGGGSLQGEFRNGRIYTGSGESRDQHGNPVVGRWIRGIPLPPIESAAVPVADTKKDE